MSQKTTFISKYRNYGITLSNGTRVKFQENIYATDNPELAKELKASKAYGKDFNEVATPEEPVKGTKK